MKIGVLALQGDFEKHARAVSYLGHSAICVKDLKNLASCDKLIIPGGESTTMIRLIEELELRQSILNFAQNHALMGTCAGLIILGSHAPQLPYPSLNLIDISLKRNAYGRQINSFVDKIHLNLDGVESEFEGVFIRAPRINSLGANVKALGYHGSDVVMAVNDKVLVASFHPELTDDLKIHDYFITKVGTDLSFRG